MAPDLNSLPPSPTLGRTPDTMTGSETHASAHSPSLSSLQAAAAINAGMRNPNSPRASGTQRRRSSLMTNLHLNDAQIPGPGEMQESHHHRAPSLGQMQDSHHHRAPSLGQMHQELENEQEAQVNRLLHMIRVQQDQIDELHADQPVIASTSASANAGAGDGAGAGATASASAGASAPVTDSETRPRTLSSSSRQQAALPQRPVTLSRHSSQAVSVTSGPRSSSRSPALRPVGSPYDSQREDWLLGANRDENAFYQAETQMLTRENQMLKARIRELERQLAHPDASLTPHQPPTSHSPAVISPLTSPPIISEPTRQP